MHSSSSKSAVMQTGVQQQYKCQQQLCSMCHWLHCNLKLTGCDLETAQAELLAMSQAQSILVRRNKVSVIMSIAAEILHVHVCCVNQNTYSALSGQPERGHHGLNLKIFQDLSSAALPQVHTGLKTLTAIILTDICCRDYSSRCICSRSV